MKKITSLILLFSILYSCGVKQTQRLVGEGNYDEAIQTALSNLRTNKDKKSKQDYIYLLEEAFAKAKEKDLNAIQIINMGANPNDYEKLYNLYLQLNERQEKIKPLLPLALIKENRNAIFPFENYNKQIVESRQNLVAFLYQNALQLMKNQNKLDYRKAFEDLNYLNELIPNYKNVSSLREEALIRGTDYVLVKTKNETNTIIPAQLQTDLLDFSTFKLNNRWIVYHNTAQRGIRYDYAMQILFRSIQVSPEQIKEREFTKEKEVKDGVKKVVDANGKAVIDSNGKEIVVDNMKKVAISVYEFKQFKACQVGAKVEFFNLNTNQLLQSFPLTSEFIFENTYATYKGDKRASEESYFATFDRRAVPFPTSEQMIFDAGEDLKLKIKNVLNSNQLQL